jgi:hypothetical protein
LAENPLTVPFAVNPNLIFSQKNINVRSIFVRLGSL